MWLICVDAYSQYPFVCQMTSTTTSNTIAALSQIFSSEGLPETLVSDNGPQLTSSEFKEFCENNGIRHLTTAPFHPASNGLAERFVRTFKTSVSKNIDDGQPVKNAVLKFLSTYRSIPNDEGKSPAELLHGRQIRTLLTQLPHIQKERREEKDNKSTKYRVDDLVFLRNYGRGPKWIKGQITKVLETMLYIVETYFGKCKRHQNQLKPRVENSIHPNPLNYSWHVVREEDTGEHCTQKEVVEPELRRSERIRKPVERFQAENFRK